MAYRQRKEVNFCLRPHLDDKRKPIPKPIPKPSPKSEIHVSSKITGQNMRKLFGLPPQCRPFDLERF